MNATKNWTAQRRFVDAFILCVLIVCVWLKLIYTQLSSKINPVPIMSDSNVQMYITSFLTVAIVILIAYLIGFKYGLITAFIASIILSLLLFADVIYGRYYFNPITLSILNQLYMADDVSGSAFSLIKLKDIIYFIDYLGMIVLYLAGRKFVVIKPFEKGYLYRVAVVVVALVVLFVGFSIRYSNTDTTHYAYERKYIARDLGLLYFHSYDFNERISKLMSNKSLSDDEILNVQAHNGYSNDVTNPYTGIAEGRNVYVLQMEAIQEFLVDYEVNGEKVMPFLSALKEESIYLSNCHIQTANGNTVDSELLMNVSLLPTHSGAVYYEYPDNTYLSLPKILETQGYECYSFHGYQGSFWNRVAMHSNLGFDDFYSMEDYVIDEYIGFGLGDKSFIKQTIDKNRAVANRSSYYNFMVMLSSHHPYDGFYSGPFSPEEGHANIVDRYYNSARYVDEAIEGFFEQLKDEGLYDNAIFVIYGDHAGLFGDEAAMQLANDGISYSEYEWSKYKTVPVLIHVPGELEDGVKVDYVTGQIDMMPTLANLMNLDVDYTLGSDVLSATYESMVVKRFGDVITNDFIYLSSAKEAYDYTTGSVIPIENYESQVKKAHGYLTVIDTILSTDYFSEEQ